MNSCFLFDESNEPAPAPTASTLSTIEPVEGEALQLYGKYFTNDMQLYLEGVALPYTRPDHQTLTFTVDETHNSGKFYAIHRGDTLYRAFISIQDSPWEIKYKLPNLYDDWYSQDFITADYGFFSVSHQVYRLQNGAAKVVYQGSNLVPLQMPAGNTAIIHKDWEMVKTTDNGASWQVIDFPVGYIIDEIFFFTAETGIAIGHQAMNRQAIILKTEDGGISWQLRWEYPHDLFTYYESRVNTTENGQCYIASPHNNLIVFGEENGDRWEAKAVNFPYGTNFESLVYAKTENMLWIQNVAGLYHSTDGGQTWQEVIPGFMNSGERARSIHFSNQYKGVILSSRGGIFTTEDGGKHWKGRYTTDFYAISRLPNTSQYLVRQGDYITTKVF